MKATQLEDNTFVYCVIKLHSVSPSSFSSQGRQPPEMKLKPK